MKAMLKKAFRPCISLLLVACLMLGLCSNGLIALAEGRKGGSTNVPTQKPVINYVSLGDSMTNGYGLPGYDMDSGVADYGDGSYANLFAAWLKEAGYADKVNHAQLAMSGLRAEDLHWLLELDYENADAISLTDGEWNEEAWNAMFTTGDYWTWNEICTHSRTHSTVQAILATGYDAFPSTYVDEENGEVALIAKYFQESVKNADIISLGIGNGDFGVFMMGRLMEAMEFGGADAADALVYEVENAIRELDPAMQKQVKVLIDQMYASLEQMIAGKTLPVAEEQKDALLNTAVYTSISFLLGYMGTMEAILKLNPDAQIIQVALMNTLGNDKVAGDVTLGELMSSVYNYLNAYIAGLPAAAQTVGLKAYAQAEFYYAEAAEVQCIVDVFGELVADEDSVIRDRFVENIVGTESNPGMIWGLLMESVELPGGYNLKFVTLEQIKNFEAMTLAQRADYTADEATAEIAVSCAIYLGVEQAILGSADEPVTLGTMAGLGNLGSAFGSIAGAFQGEAVYSDAVREAAASAIANKINAMAKEENPDANVNVTAQQILDLYADQSDANLLNFAFVLAGAIGGVPADMLEKIYNGTEITMDDAYEAIASETVKILKDEYGVEVEITAQTVKDVYERKPGHNATVLDLTCELVAAAASDALGLTITPEEVKAIHGGNHAVTMDLAFRVVANEAGIDGLTADMVRDLYDDNKLAVLELFFDMAAEDESNEYGLTAEDFEALYNGTVNAHIMDVIFGNADVEDMDEATLRALYDGDADVALQVIIDKLVEEGADREILEAVLVEGKDARTVIVEQIVAEGELTEQQVNNLLDGTVSAFELALDMIAEEEGTTRGALLEAYENDPEVKEAVDTLASELNNLKADAEQAIDDLNEAAAESANNIDTLIADVQGAIDDAIVDLQDEIQNQVDTNYEDLRNELVDKLDNDVVPQINTEVVNGVNDAMEQIYENVDTAVETARDTLEQDAAELQQQVREQVDGLVDAIRNALPQMDNLCLALNLPETLSDAMLADETVAGLLSMYGRCMLANGVGCHPSADGHEDLFRAVKYAYVNGYTAQDEIIDKIDFINKYILSFGQEIDAILNENLAQVVKELKADLAKLYADLETEALALDAELDRLSREELALLKQLNADRAVLMEELVALQARLAELENGQNARTNTTNSKSPETLAQELKAAIAETEAAIAELDAAIAALNAQIEADMQGIASIQASIAAIKAEILDTEAALAEVEAAIAQLNADLKVLYDATLVLADAAYNVYGLTLAHVDVNKVIAAVNTLMELVPVMTEELETVYNKILVAMDKTMAAGENIDAFLNSIKDEFDSIVNGAEELVGIQAEKLAAIREAIASCQEKINTVISENRPALEQGLKNTYADLEALILHKIEGTKQWLLNNQDDPRVVAVAMAYMYCVENGYVQQAKDLIKTYTQLLNAEIGKLEVELEKAEQLLNVELKKAERELRDRLTALKAELADIEAQLLNAVDAETRAALEKAKAELEAQIVIVEVKLEQLEAKAQQLAAYIETVCAAICQTKLALQDVIDAAAVVGDDLVALWNALCNLSLELRELGCAVGTLADATVNELCQLLEYCGIVADELIDLLETLPAYAKLLKDAADMVTDVENWKALAEQVKAAVNNLVEKLSGLLTEEQICEFLKYLVEKYGPVVAEQLLDMLTYLFLEYGHDVAVAFYYFLYDHPYEVIAFFQEYGDEIADLIIEYGPVVLAIIGYALSIYGEDLAAYIVENHKAILDGIIYWGDIHNDKMMALLQVYAEALGLCDMVRQQIQDLQDMLECLKQQLQDLKQQLENACDELKAQIEKQIAAVEEKIAQIEEALRELIAQLEELYQQIIDIAEAIKDVFDAMKELHDIIAGKVEGSIQEALKALEDAMDKLAEFIDIVEDVIDAIEAFIEYLQDLKEELCQIIQQIEALIEQIENAIIEMNERVEEILAELEQIIEDMKQTLEQIQAAVEEMIDCAEQKLSELKACLEALIAEIRAAVEALKAKVQELFNNTLYADYIVSKDSYYVSLGDSTTTGIATGDPAYGNFGYMTKVPNSFPYKLAQELGLDVDTQFAQLAMAGLRPTDLRYILDENFQPDDYALNRNNDRINAYAGGIDQMRADYLAELAKADLVTISIGSCNFNDFVMTQIKGELAEYLNQELAFWLNNPYFGPMLRDGISEYVDLDSTAYEMDWVNYIGEDGVKALNETLAVLRENVIANGVNEVITIDLGETFGLSVPAGTIVVNIPAADLMVYMAECFLYAYVTFAMDYAAAYDLVRQAAPNATLVIVGMYNPADNLVINVGDMALPIGDLYAGFATAINLHHITYALEAENTIYVDIPNTESINDQVLSEIGTEFDLMDYIMYNLETAPDFHASADGHTYIKDEIMDQLNVTMYGLLGDINLDGRVNGSDMNLLYRYIMEDVELTGLQLYVANLNQDGRVNGSDLCMLYRYIMEDETLAWEPSLARG